MNNHIHPVIREGVDLLFKICLSFYLISEALKIFLH